MSSYSVLSKSTVLDYLYADLASDSETTDAVSEPQILQLLQGWSGEIHPRLRSASVRALSAIAASTQ